MMDKEEFIKYVEKINERIREKLKDDGKALEFYSHLVVCFNRICGESQKQKEVIDKAIEYMKKHVEIKIFSDGYELYEINNGNDKFCEELLDILEGEQNG